MTQKVEIAGHSKTTFAGTQRALPRVRLDWILYVSLRSGNGGIVLDISEKGLALQTADKFGASGPIYFRFLVPALERVEVTAELIWIDETHKRGGLQFVDLPENVLEEIRGWTSRFAAAQAPVAPSENQSLNAREPATGPQERLVEAAPQSSEARVADVRAGTVNSQVRAAEAEAQEQARRRAADAEKQSRYETAVPEADAASSHLRPLEAEGRAPVRSQQQNAEEQTAKPKAIRLDATPPVSATDASRESSSTSARAKEPPRKLRIVLAPPEDSGNARRGAPTFGALRSGTLGSADAEAQSENDRARRGDFPDHVRGLYAQHLEDDEAPWHWSATLIVAVVLGAAVTLFGFMYKVPIGRSMVRLGQKISGIATTQRAHQEAPPPPAGNESVPGGAASDATEANSQASATAQQSSGKPSIEISSRDAGVAPGAVGEASRGSATKSRGASGSSAEAWRYAQQHPRRPGGAAGAATSETSRGDSASGANSGIGSSEANGQPELTLARQYLSQGNSAGAAEVLWLAVEKGNTEAEVQLADLYGRGDGVKKNCLQARVLVTAASEKSDFLAANETARLNALGCK